MPGAHTSLAFLNHIFECTTLIKFRMYNIIHTVRYSDVHWLQISLIKEAPNSSTKQTQMPELE